MSGLWGIFGGAKEEPKRSSVTRPPAPYPPATAPIKSHPQVASPQTGQPSGGFFNLPAAAQKPSSDGTEGRRDSRGASMSMPAGANLFGGMHVAPTSVPITTAPAASGFDFLSGSASAGTNSVAPPVASSFSFLTSTAPADTASVPPPQDTASTLGSGFSFLSNPAPAAVDVPSHPSTVAPVVPTASVAPLLNVAPIDSLAPVTVVPANVKKKKTGFRPGSEREASNTSETPSSILSGLQVHDSSAAVEEQPAAPAPSGLLAGLQVYDSQAEDPSLNILPGSQFGLGGSVAPVMPEVTAIQGTSAVTSGFSFVNTSAITETPPIEPTSLLAGLNIYTPGAADATVKTVSPVEVAPKAVSTATSVSSPPVQQQQQQEKAAQPTVKATSSQATPVHQLQNAFSRLASATTALQSKFAVVKRRLNENLVADRQLTSELDAIRDQLTDVETQQNDAIKTEQFELAEALNSKVDTLRSCLAEVEQKKRALASEKASLEAEQQATFAESLTSVNEALVGLKQFCEGQDVSLNKFRQEASGKHASTSERLNNDEDQLKLKQEHIEKDKQLLLVEKEEVEKAITDQTTELVAQVTTFKQKHTQLAEEVAELERKLAEKRAEERAAAAQLEEAESKIKQIRSKFDKQAKRLETKQEAVNQELKECENELRVVATAKSEFAEQQAKDYAAEVGYLRQLKYATSASHTLEQLRKALSEGAAQRAALADAATQAALGMLGLQSTVDNALRGLRGIQGRKANLESQANAVRNTIQSVDQKLPALNEEKKAAVAERKFKEAGRLTDEIKRLTTQREEAERELSTCLSAIDEIETSVVSEQEVVDKARAQLLQYEKSADLQRVSLLSDAVKHLNGALRQLAKGRHTTGKLDTVLPKPADNIAVPLPSDDALGIVIDNDRTPAQVSAIQFLQYEKDTLFEELSQLSAKHGLPVNVDVETDKDDDDAVAEESDAVAPAAVEEKVNVTPADHHTTALSAADAAPINEEPHDESSAAREESSAAHEESSAAQEESEAPLAADAEGAAIDADNATAEAEYDPESSVSHEPLVVDAASLARSYLSVLAAIREKEDVIADAVSREDFDTADAAQVDIDSFVEHRSMLLQRAQALGLGEEDLLRFNTAAATAEEDRTSETANISEAAVASETKTDGVEESSEAPVEAAASGFSFLTAQAPVVESVEES